MEKIEIIPTHVEVAGAESKIKDTDKVRTTPIDISGVIQTTEFQADLILPNPDLRLNTIIGKVTIRVIIKEKDKEEESAKKEGSKKVKGLSKLKEE